MELIPTRLEGPLLIEPRVFPDNRGFFAETFRSNVFADFGITEPMVQQNHSRSSYGAVRGMHFHIGDGVSKLVRCVRGEILDVLVDIRRSSPTFGQWEAFPLDGEALRILYAPIGFAHGFCTLTDDTLVAYKVDARHAPEADGGLPWNDPAFGIPWPAPAPLLSERDRGHAPFAAFETPFVAGIEW